MGTHPGDGGNGPPDGDRTPDPELPELPPEWGEVTIPDDASELAAEAEEIRSELLREQRSGSGRAEPSIALPLFIMSVAVVITLVSLFAMSWSGTSSGRGGDPSDGADDRTPLPAISLPDVTGRYVTLASQGPAAILLVESCDCPELVAATVSAAPSGVTVMAVGEEPPAPPDGLAPDKPAPLLLGDPDRSVRGALGLGDPPFGAASVVLVDGDGRVVRSYHTATSVAPYQNDLADLPAA